MRRIIAAILALAALMGLSAVFSSAAFADGDPASDVLVYKPVFTPYDSGGTAYEIARLNALVEAVTRAGYPLRVALVGSSSDLGTVTQLWNDPSDYGIYLGKELSYVYHGTLLVVMPTGYGLRAPTSAIPAGDRKWGQNVVAPGSDLVAGAITQVAHLAADNGIAVPRKLTVDLDRGSGSQTATGPLIGFIAGLVAIVAAWAVSLRLKPLRRRAVA